MLQTCSAGRFPEREAPSPPCRRDERAPGAALNRVQLNAEQESDALVAGSPPRCPGRGCAICPPCTAPAVGRGWDLTPAPPGAQLQPPSPAHGHPRCPYSLRGAPCGGSTFAPLHPTLPSLGGPCPASPHPPIPGGPYPMGTPYSIGTPTHYPIGPPTPPHRTPTKPLNQGSHSPGQLTACP